MPDCHDEIDLCCDCLLQKERDRYREALEEVKAFVCGEAVTKWGTDLQTTNSRIRIANTCDVALLGLK